MIVAPGQRQRVGCKFGLSAQHAEALDRRPRPARIEIADTDLAAYDHDRRFRALRLFGIGGRAVQIFLLVGPIAVEDHFDDGVQALLGRVFLVDQIKDDRARPALAQGGRGGRDPAILKCGRAHPGGRIDEGGALKAGLDNAEAAARRQRLSDRRGSLRRRSRGRPGHYGDRQSAQRRPYQTPAIRLEFGCAHVPLLQNQRSTNLCVAPLRWCAVPFADPSLCRDNSSAAIAAGQSYGTGTSI